jgi:exopolysaccharide biosynthesis polyprenyl glycosylphosphotransferase
LNPQRESAETLSPSPYVRWVSSVTALPQTVGRGLQRGRVTELRPRAEDYEVDRGQAQKRDARYRRFLGVADALAGMLALALSVDVLGEDRLQASSLILAPIVIAVYKIAGLYDRDEFRLRKTTLDEAPSILQAATLFTLLLAIFEGPFLVGELGDNQILAVWMTLFGFTMCGRVFARGLAGRATSPDRCLVLGGASSTLQLKRKLEESNHIRAVIVGRIGLENDEWADNSVLGSLADLDRVITEHRVERVIVAPRTADTEHSMLDIVQRVKSHGVKVSVLPRLFEVVGTSVEFDHVEGLTLLGVRRFGLTQSSALVKRGLDIFGSALGLLVLSPFFALMALLIRLDSPGGAFFRQTRVGQDGRHFQMLKFRSMRQDAEAIKAELAEQNVADGLFKIPEDPRITRVGRLLRKGSLDELPQLWNVLRGDMSLVGPRPLILEEDLRVEGWHRRRLHLKPGMTGHWQVLGSTRIPLREMVTIDYLYVANWSLWNDVKILIRTVPHVLARRGV